jgi:TusA-related sulfurtransferase
MTIGRQNARNGFAAEIDLSGVDCPINYAKIIVIMAKINRGEKLKAVLDPGESIKNVSTSLDMDGHRILSIDKLSNGTYELVVEKRH